MGEGQRQRDVGEGTDNRPVLLLYYCYWIMGVVFRVIHSPVLGLLPNFCAIAGCQVINVNIAFVNYDSR